ncbi:MAG: DNA-directed RNA polymerase subunit N [Candidatus Methanomethylicota archaeon]|uniref:DNA-directed RNA polymerase subunit Rpo10 n=1 Tax=Thermoproteota archaeon TaxID=2056631 RepID=A0A497EVS6_9CREN|nr:MAG: DNA-directed RNA polymerase subunit N [Candidatus Verstraetearchaeota archaeon]
MMIPIRCFTCGALIADKYEEFEKRVKAGEHPSKVLDDLGIKRYCCRRMLLSHVELIDEVILLHEIYGGHKKPRRSVD